MGFLNKLFKKPVTEAASVHLLSMIVLPRKDSFSFKQFAGDVKDTLGVDIQSDNNDNKAAAFTIIGEQVALMNMDFQIPLGDITGTARYAYNWQNALKDLESHQAHLIVVLTNGSQSPIERFKLRTKMICSVLRTTDAIGVYDGEQSLLIPRVDYLTEAQTMYDDHLPLNLWIYFGLRTIDGKTNGYTYGLKAFGKQEMEILNSNKSLQEIREMLWNAAHYVLMTDVIFIDGQTFGYTENEKLKISYSKARFAGGYSFKFAY